MGANNQFTLILANDKLRSYRRVSLLVILLHFFFFNYYLVTSGAILPVVVAVVVSTIAIAFAILSLRKKNLIAIPDAIWFLLLAGCWLWLGVYWLAAVLLLLAFFDWLTLRPLAVRFSDEGIAYPSFPPKKIGWQELNNVILKDGILTIDFKNDKLLQSALARESEGAAEAPFNAYCQLRLAAAQ